MAKQQRKPLSPTDGFTVERLLLGPQRLQETLDFVGALGHHCPTPSREQLTARWRKASNEYERLVRSEDGAADGAQVLPLPQAMNRHLARLIELPGVQRTFDTVPVSFGMVELDRLVISQYSMTQAVVERIVDAHPLPLRPARLAELCLPLKAPAARFHLAGTAGREFTFVSDAHDMRFLDARVLDAADVRQTDVKGHPQSVVALNVGFSTNLLNGVRYNGRVAINNGHHRALALRQMGFTHVPCLIQPCTSLDDLWQAATQELCDNVDLYFHSPRPPLLRDFDNPRLTLNLQAPRMRRVVTLKVEVQRRMMVI